MKASFFKLSLASACVFSAAIAASMTGCGDDGNKTDGGMMDVTTGDVTMMPDAPGMDTGTDTGVDAGPAKPKLIVVHASGEQGAIRICFATQSGVTPLPALPNSLTPSQMAAGLPFPGIYPGTGGPFPDTGTDVSTLGAITPYVINAAKIQNHKKGEMPKEKVCTDMIVAADAGADAGIGLVENTDYFTLPTIPANTFQRGKTYILALAGCSKNAASLAAGGKCGPNWNAMTGNLEVKIFSVDPAKPAMTKTGAQYIHLSPVTQLIGPGGVIGSIGTPGGQPDGGLLLEIINTTPATYPNIQPAMTATALTSPKVNSFIASTLVLGDGGLGSSVLLPLTAVEQLTTGVPPDGGIIYSANASFSFIAVGDLTREADGGPFVPMDGGPGGSVGRGYAFHILGFPNDPVIPPLQ